LRIEPFAADCLNLATLARVQRAHGLQQQTGGADQATRRGRQVPNPVPDCARHRRSLFDLRFIAAVGDL
jgi:hypothetical protein